MGVRGGKMSTMGTGDDGHIGGGTIVEGGRKRATKEVERGRRRRGKMASMEGAALG
jgi:hypothetical protein